MSSADDIHIHLGDAKTTAVVDEQPLPSSGLATYVAVVGDVASVQLPIYVHEAALEGMENHAASSPRAEIGGALLGGVYRWKDSLYVRVDDFAAAKSATENRSSLTFTHETWSQLNSEREARMPELGMVGWYHTHPDLGVFLSDKDRFIQQSLFSGAEQIALVIDPVSNERAFFHWSNGQMSKLTGFYIFGDASRSTEIERSVSRMQTGRHDRKQMAERSASPPTPVVNKVVFAEPCINLYYLLPRPMRRLLGIMNGETAPRLSVKSLIIWALLLALLYQVFVVPRAAAPARGYDAAVHKMFASAFEQSGDTEEAVREYRRYLCLRQNDVAAWRGLLGLLAKNSQTRGGQATIALGIEAGRLRAMAEQEAFKADYRGAYALYSLIANYPGVAQPADAPYQRVFGYLAGIISTRPTKADLAEVRSRFPDIDKVLEKRGH